MGDLSVLKAPLRRGFSYYTTITRPTKKVPFYRHFWYPLRGRFFIFGNKQKKKV